VGIIEESENEIAVEPIVKDEGIVDGNEKECINDLNDDSILPESIFDQTIDRMASELSGEIIRRSADEFLHREEIIEPLDNNENEHHTSEKDISSNLNETPQEEVHKSRMDIEGSKVRDEREELLLLKEQLANERLRLELEAEKENLAELAKKRENEKSERNTEKSEIEKMKNDLLTEVASVMLLKETAIDAIENAIKTLSTQIPLKKLESDLSEVIEKEKTSSSLSREPI
jgi:hypothetical protein